MILTYEKISELNRSEKQDKFKLQKLPKNFLTELAEYFKLKQGTREEASTRTRLQSLLKLRRKKIFNNISLGNTANILDDLEGAELELCKELIRILKKYDNTFKGLFEEPQDFQDNVNLNKKLQEIYNKEKNNLEKKIPESELIGNEIGLKNDEQRGKDTKPEDKINSSPIKEKIGENFSENNPQKDKLKVVFLLDIPEIITPSGEICSFRKEEEKELDCEFAAQLKEQGFCRFK